MNRAIFLVLLLVGSVGAEAQQTSPAQLRIPLGQVVERMVSRADPEMSYALYLPSGYRAERKWPLLIAMDPRGRALIPMELFRPEAEKLGYIVVSSYNTQSDAAWTPNVSAMKAILADIPQMFAIDDRRIYLTGFSGTAMGGWSFANNLTPHVAGLINFCGAVFDWSKPVKGAAYAFFGASGMIDFNYEDMRALDTTLDSLEIRHRIVYFDGDHDWGPPEICSEGLDWMEFQAMKTKLRPPDQKWMDDLFAARMRKAQELENSGNLFEALREYRSLNSDFAGMEAMEAVSEKIKTLEGARAVKDTIRSMDHLAVDQQEFVQKLFAYFDEVRSPTEPGQEINRQNALRISWLAKQATGSRDRLQALWAQRMLEIAFVQASFYVPRYYLESGNSQRALKVLALADRIKPDHRRILYMKAWAYTVAKDEESALKLLGRMVDLQYISSAETLEEDPNFAGLHKNPGFQNLLARLKSS